MTSPQQALACVRTFWFDELAPKDWFAKSDELDATIRERFGDLHHRVATGELDALLTTPGNCLSAIIVLDQFSRNIYRDRPEAFAWDNRALQIARDAIGRHWDRELTPDERSFMYMPFMHSERLNDHEQAVALFTDLANKKNLEFELRHKAIIERFGRYPHRNDILGRKSTREEIEFLRQPGSSF